ncbi:MAG: saccharopine dehydrogenase NADP-binding domain-containing protein [Calditrichaeota bacterium]|nr:saccharopine dehydrogenase NADP-binding domain-containing protein [Calditrichota bacterium]MCB0304977.1 saccharopine dehydrogenase NADP-binding domain-containing protein [Calditrichota bacterium]
MKNVLVLGAGLVSRPLVHYLLRKEFTVTVASRTVSKAEALIAGFANGKAEALNVKDDQRLEQLVADSDLAISLLPYTYHLQVAGHCLKHRKHLITTSYVSPAMQALDREAREAGVLFLNEIGLDPGIDHMSAMKIIHQVEKAGGKVTSFRSYCGGLPAMQHNNNPFGYKFSWSPRGVVMAGRNNGQYLENGEVVFIPNRDLFKQYEIIDIEGVGAFEAYTNRDALPYRELYGLSDASTVFRGTLRNPGWCQTMDKARELGLFDDAPRQDLAGLTWRKMMLRLTGQPDDGDIYAGIAAYLGLKPHDTVMKRFQWLGLFAARDLPAENNVMDMFCALLQEKLAMAESDLDLIVLHHRFEAAYAGRKERITSTLVDTGRPGGDTAMSRTVSLPAAIAANLILRNEIDLTGVHIPIQAEIYEAVLTELEKTGLKFIEKTLPESRRKH